MKQEGMYFRENCIIKSAFNKTLRPIKINKVDIEEIVLSHKTLYGKESLNIL